ncbi:MAG: hypothetical protein ACD_71C00154G0002 [uncultured bacterium (gcode 4)]|uniref:Uncharacterized protein n=1 Tax=uncultured bacterium (gcode 4) TaxID=1234023 RepID=K1YN40_9BACT|nr:MAG: hypothetical protein ACD_71C00154G0002 [uncultured bacterium (gcode 4)]
MNNSKSTPKTCQKEDANNVGLLRLLESLENDPHILSQETKIAKLKVADKMYSLRCLEIFHVSESMLTKWHVEKAKKQVQETREYILPKIAEDGLYKEHLLMDIERVEKRISEIELLLTQREIEETVNITLIS